MKSGWRNWKGIHCIFEVPFNDFLQYLSPSRLSLCLSLSLAFARSFHHIDSKNVVRCFFVVAAIATIHLTLCCSCGIEMISIWLALINASLCGDFPVEILLCKSEVFGWFRYRKEIWWNVQDFYILLVFSCVILMLLLLLLLMLFLLELEAIDAYAWANIYTE